MQHVPFADLAAQTAEVRDLVDKAWREMLDDSSFVRGPQVTSFEEEWARYCGVGHAIGVANGTDALQLVLRALGVGPGDEVVVPANTFVATAEAVVLVGAVPVFADVDPRTLLVTPEAFEAVATPRTRVLMAVHLFGQPADMDALVAAAERRGVLVVEDAAQAHGGRWRGRPVGSLGVAACFSFYPGKNLGAFGDGGAVVTDDDVLAARVASLRDHGRIDGSHYDHGAIGTNSRLDSLQAAVLSAKLRRLDEWTQARRAVAARYAEAFAGTPVRWVGNRPEAEHVHHLAVVRVPGRDAVRARLARAGIGTGVHYPTPCHLVSAYADYHRGPLPEVEAAAEEILSLPMFPHMTAEQVDRVCDEVLAAAGEEVLSDVG